MRSVMRRTAMHICRSTVAFITMTIGLVLIIVLCVTGTVLSQEEIGSQEMESYYRVQEKLLLNRTREYLTDKGYRNSGVTLTRVVDEEGNRNYTYTIHHGSIDKLEEADRELLIQELAELSVLGENCSFDYRFL